MISQAEKHETLASGLTYLEARLLLHLVGFFKFILNIPNRMVRVTAKLASRDVRTTVGKNLIKLLAVEVPAADAWRPSLLHKLLGNRLEGHFKANVGEVAKLSGLSPLLVAS